MYQLKLGGKNRKEARTTTGLPKGGFGSLFYFFRGTLPAFHVQRGTCWPHPLLSSLLPARELIMINVHIRQPIHIITRPDCLVVSLICRPLVSWLLYFWPLSSQHPQFSQTKLNQTPAVPQNSLLSQALYLGACCFSSLVHPSLHPPSQPPLIS